MDDRLQSIITSSKNAIINVVINTYDYLDNILVFKEYEINPDDDLITKTKMFILRYRRIIGILLLIILVYIGFNCHFGQNRSKSTNEHNYEDSNQDSHKDQKKNIQNIQNGGKINFSGAIKKKFASISPSAIKDKIDLKKIEYSGEGKLSSKAKKAIGDSSIGKTFSQIKEAGAYNAGAYVGNKFKEFAGWLYQILFAIAISIAICMVVLPSLSFFIIGIICFFLLKSKISGFKSL